MVKFKSLPYIPLRITSRFGPRNTGIAGASTNHLGIDLGTDKGVYKGTKDGGPVRTVMPGTVVQSYWHSMRGWAVLIDHGTHGEKNIKTLYQHLKEKGAEAGTAVRAGDIIGIMGNTGVGAQLHLHFELRENNVCINPESYLREVKPVDEDRVREIIKEMLQGKDTKVSGWARDEMAKAVAGGITDGSRPGGYATREEVAVMIGRK